MSEAVAAERAGVTVRFLRIGRGNRFRVVTLWGGRDLGEVHESADGTWIATKRGMPRDLVLGGWASRRAAAEFLAGGVRRRSA
jgi:hypothetical protein